MRKSKQLGLFANPETTEVQAIDKVETRRKSPIQYIIETQKLRARQDLLKLRIAVDAAENPQNYDRELLHNIYREILKDPNLVSQWESRKMKTKQRSFKVKTPDGKKEVPEMTRVLESEWFYDWMDACLDSILWGFTLTEFGPLENGQFLHFRVGDKIYDPITVIDRDHVKPEFGMIVKSPGDREGIRFDDPKYTNYLMFVGKQNSYGILEKAATMILCKNNAVGNWSEWAEVFGMDKRVGYTESQGEDRRAFIKALRDMGANSYGVFTSRDKIEYLGTNRSDAYLVYKEFLTYIDEQISKLIFGQDVVTNNTGRVVGTVGENMANMYGDSDSRFIKNLVNSRLMPLMENLGFQWKGMVFDWDTSEKVSMAERATIDLQIKNMGFMHSPEYINNTYGTEVTPMPEEPKVVPMKRING